MPSEPPTDDALLARLNALKKTNISVSTTPHASITPTRPSRPAAQDDDLLARFARLGSASPKSFPSPRRDEGGRAPVVAPGAESYLEGVAEGIGSGGGETQVNEEDERSLEELIAELGLGGGGEGQAGWDVSRGEERDLGRLVGEVRGVLPDVRGASRERLQSGRGRRGKEKEEEVGVDWEDLEVDVGGGGVRVRKGGDLETTVNKKRGDEEEELGEIMQEALDDPENSRGDTEEREESKTQLDHLENDSKKEEEDNRPSRTEDEEAEELIARALKENTGPPTPLDNSEQQSDVNEDNNNIAEDNDDDEPDLALPSVPSDPSSLPNTLATEEDLTTRFAALFSSPVPSSTSDDLTLPSVPTAFKSKPQPKPHSNLPTFTDEEIASWCCICNDDATLKCLGCDGDLYCRDCWMEGHRGESAGWEERKHRAVVYSKDGKGDGEEKVKKERRLVGAG